MANVEVSGTTARVPVPSVKVRWLPAVEVQTPPVGPLQVIPE
jgi:hypothetical protein